MHLALFDVFSFDDVIRKLAVERAEQFFFPFSNIPDSIFESGLIWGHARSFRIPKIQGGDIDRSISYSSCQKERISCFLEETLTYIWTTSDNHHCLDLTPK